MGEGENKTWARVLDSRVKACWILIQEIFVYDVNFARRYSHLIFLVVHLKLLKTSNTFSQELYLGGFENSI